MHVCEYICTCIVSTTQEKKAQFQIILPLFKARVLLSAKECNSVLFITIYDTAFSITIQRHNKQNDWKIFVYLLSANKDDKKHDCHRHYATWSTKIFCF